MMSVHLPAFLPVLLSQILIIPALVGSECGIIPNHPGGAYAIGDTVTWHLTLADAALTSAPYAIKANGATTVEQGVVTITQGTAAVQTTASQPGALLLELTLPSGVRYGGAVVAPERIPVSCPPPDDFRAFWDAHIAELAQVPEQPELVAKDSGDPAVALWTLTLGNIRGSHVRGYFAKPTSGDRFPGMVAVQYAGVYPLDPHEAVRWAKAGWMVFNISAHDLPVDADRAFYDQQQAGPLANYGHIGSEDRETCYFLRVFLGCYRAVEYVRQRPEWNQRTLLAQGASQGGWQAIAAAALHPAVTAVTANIPAGCDHTGADLGRAPGWPHMVNSWNGRDAQRAHATSRYFDTVNFARFVHCPTLIGLGLIDTTCPPAGVFAAYHALAGPKRVVVMPQADHMQPHGAYYAVHSAWLTNLLAHREPPLVPTP